MNKRSFRRQSAAERLSSIAEGWYLTEPVLFAAWTTHDKVAANGLKTIRSGNGKVSYNPTFIESMDRGTLETVLKFETLRILLGHPYLRRKPSAEIAYAASNVSIQEMLRSDLPIPLANELLQGEEDEINSRSFEFYYQRLSEQQTDTEESENEASANEEIGSDQTSTSNAEQEESSDSDDEERTPEDTSHDSADNHEGSASDSREDEASLDNYADPSKVGMENACQWEQDDLQREEIRDVIADAAAAENWGTLPGSVRQELVASIRVKLDYRSVLRRFRQSIQSVDRRLTRMRPSRRYGFEMMGSRYAASSSLLMAIDVSGSMSHEDIEMGLGVVQRFFRHSVPTIDVLFFDTEIQGEVLKLKRRRPSYTITGRGGTSFDPLMRYIESHPSYDGLIIFTDGYAPVPKPPSNRRTRVLWMFRDEEAHEKQANNFASIGKSVFLKS
ncbi:MAG: VWA-like domain-containing protein [Planctomycetota bacterium]